MAHHNTIGYKIRLIHNSVHRIMEAKRIENEGNMTGMQRWLLGFLQKNKDKAIYQKDIEAEFSISRATASNMLAGMERKGLIRRAAVAHDARLKKIELTEKAAAIVAKADKDIDEMEEKLKKGMTEEEIAVFLTLLDKVIQNIDENAENIPQDTICRREK